MARRPSCRRSAPAAARPGDLAVEDDRLLALGFGQVPLGVPQAQGADEAALLRHLVAGLDLRTVHEVLGKTDPAGADALGVGGQHDVGRAQGAVIHVPVRGRVPVDADDVVGVIEDVVIGVVQPFPVLGQPGKVRKVLFEPGLDLVGKGGDLFPSLQGHETPGLHAGAGGGLGADGQQLQDLFFGDGPVLIGAAGTAGEDALQGVHERPPGSEKEGNVRRLRGHPASIARGLAKVEQEERPQAVCGGHPRRQAALVREARRRRMLSAKPGEKGGRLLHLGAASPSRDARSCGKRRACGKPDGDGRPSCDRQ